MIDAPGELLATSVPPIGRAEAEELARTYFGLQAIANPLKGERDSNFLLEAVDGRRFVLKLANPAEDRAVIDFQTRALQHIARVDPTLPVPHVVPACDGTDMVAIDGPAGSRLLRVLTFVEGSPLHSVPHSSGQRRQIGTLVARLDRALENFSHPAADFTLLWDIKRAASVRDLFDHLPSDRDHNLPRFFLDSFEEHVLPVLNQLRTQVIHNDMNPHNLLVRSDSKDEIAGIIDFGDMVRSPLAQEVAVAAAYQLHGAGHPLAGAADVIAGYHAHLPLLDREIDLLFDFIATRLVLIVTIGGWRAARYPENSAYILRNNAAAWTGLAKLAALKRDEARAYLHAACEGSIPR
ncbi:phosphotransferase [Microvirga makkahensis]|nr:phosphotransferase [Microvirga makkahensis]